GEFIGDNGVTALPDGNYVVNSRYGYGDRGAATWGDGTTGTTLDGQNTIDPQNSLVGTLGNTGLRASLPSGPLPGSFLAAFLTENGGRVTVGLPDPNSLTFGVIPDQTLTVTPSFLTHTLNAGTSVTLEASDALTVNSPIAETPTGTAS